MNSPFLFRCLDLQHLQFNAIVILATVIRNFTGSCHFSGEGSAEDEKDGPEETARQAAADSQSVKLPDFFSMKDPR